MILKLYGLRKDKLHWTQAQMAKYLHISPQTYRNKELGHTQFTSDEMFAISRLLHASVEDIFLPIDVPNRHKKEAANG